VVGLIIMAPEFTRVLQGPDYVSKCSIQSLDFIGDSMLFAKGLHKRSNFVQIVTRHSGEQVVLNLEVEVSSEPVVECTLLYIASGMKLQWQPRTFLVFVNLHRNVVRLANPNKPMTF